METLRCYICVYAATLVRAIIAWHRLSYILNIGNGPWIARNTPVATFRIKVYQGVSQFMKSRDNWTLKQNTISHHHRSVCSISSVAMKQQYMIRIEYNQHDSETMTLHAGEYVTGVHPMHMQRPTPRQLLCHIPSHLSINGKMKGWNEMPEWSCLTLRLTYPATTKYPGPKTGQFLPEPTADPTISTISTGKLSTRYHTGLIPSCGICRINWLLQSHTRPVMPERAQWCLITARGESEIPVVSGKYWACAEFDWTLSSAFEGYLPGIMVVIDGCAWCSEDW